MALITCPECGGMVSDTAASCPHCGYQEAPGVATVRITRERRLVNAAHRIEVGIDGELVASLKNGETAEFGVLAGEHVLAVRLAALISATRNEVGRIVVNAGEVREFVCYANRSGLSLFLSEI